MRRSLRATTPPTATLTSDEAFYAGGEVVQAGFWKRVAASIIDAFAIDIPVAIVAMIVGGLIFTLAGSQGPIVAATAVSVAASKAVLDRPDHGHRAGAAEGVGTEVAARQQQAEQSQRQYRQAPAGDAVTAPAVATAIQALLDALRQDGRLATLSSDDRMLQADFELDGELRAFQSDRGDGRYDFNDVELLFGDNEFEVVLYGPQGQIKRERSSVPVGQARVPAGQTLYWAGIAEEGRDLISRSGGRP